MSCYATCQHFDLGKWCRADMVDTYGWFGGSPSLLVKMSLVLDKTGFDDGESS